MMPRNQRMPVAEPATAPVVPVIQPTSIFTTKTFREVFGLRPSSLRREVREGRLKVFKRCDKYFILGEEVLAWLRSGTVHGREPR
jgi:hypothetical protein